MAFALVTKGLIAFDLGEDAAARARARALFEEGLALPGTGGWRQWGVYGLGLVAFSEQDYGTARSFFEEGLALCIEMGNKTFVTFYLVGLARTAAAQGQPAWAAQLSGAADHLRQSIKAAVPPFVRPLYEHLKTNLQAQLGEEAFRALWEQGRTMTIEQVVRAWKPSGCDVPNLAQEFPKPVK